MLITLVRLLFLSIRVVGREYARGYTFLADRTECEGQCTYCRHSHNQAKWGDIRMKVANFVYAPSNASLWPTDEASLEQRAVAQLRTQELIDWSWERGTRFECIIGIITLRLLSYSYSDPMQFTKTDDEAMTALDFLDDFNAHTGTLDLLQSSWAALLAGGWPVFRELVEVSRKIRARLGDLEEPGGRDLLRELRQKPNECDELATPDDEAYRVAVLDSLESRDFGVDIGPHLVALRRPGGCPVGKAVAFLCLALDIVRNKQMYQGSLQERGNLVYTLVTAAQDAVSAWTKSFSNWAPFFDLLTTNWPLWSVLAELACTDSSQSCVTRSELQCFDMIARQYVSCPHALPLERKTFSGCGEHDICTFPAELDANEWCVLFDRRPPTPREPWLLGLTHDAEMRICTQCGQDGVLRTIFDHVGFRDEVATGGPAPFYVEFGARKPGMLNSAAVRQFCSWDGLLMDSQPGETPHGACPGCPGGELVHTEFVTAENVVGLFAKHGVPYDFDLLTIDCDYNDYWLWRALLTDGSFRPRVVAVDFNPDLPLHMAKTVRYEADAEWDGTVYTVASLLAYALMAHAHGYSFAYALEMGSHAFFVRSDLLAEDDRVRPLRSSKKDSHMPDRSGRQFVDVLYDFVPVNGSHRDAERSEESEAAALRRQVRELRAELRGLREGHAPTDAATPAGAAHRAAPGEPEEWRVVHQGTVRVRAAMSRSAEVLGTKPTGTSVRGWRVGDWVELEDGSGFMLAESGADVLLQASEEASSPRGPASPAAVFYDEVLRLQEAEAAKK